MPLTSNFVAIMRFMRIQANGLHLFALQTMSQSGITNSKSSETRLIFFFSWYFFSSFFSSADFAQSETRSGDCRIDDNRSAINYCNRGAKSKTVKEEKKYISKTNEINNKNEHLFFKNKMVQKFTPYCSKSIII